jgi:phenylpyruvate tautomerase
MPTLVIRTNVDKPRDELTALALEVSKSFSVVIGKPEQWVGIDIQPNQILTFAGDATTPCAFCQVNCIGNIDLERNTAVSASLAAILEARLGIPPTRYYCAFVDHARQNMAWNAHTFANLPAAPAAASTKDE